MVQALAPQPTKATTSFTLAWGLVAIQLSVYTGTESTRVERKEFLSVLGNLVPVGRSPIRKDTGAVIDTNDVARYATATNGALVLLTDDEIAQCTTRKGVGTIVAFVPVKNLGNYLAEKQDQVRPKSTKGVPDYSASKSLALLSIVMKKLKVVALVKVAMRGPARYVLLDHTGTFTYIYSADQVREAKPLNLDFKFTDQELNLAGVLIESVGIDTPVLADDTAAVVQAYVDAKAGGSAPVAVVEPEPTIDIMAAMIASIEATKAAKAGAA